MNIYIENINTIEKIHKVYTKRWRNIYEVIQKRFLMKLISSQMTTKQGIEWVDPRSKIIRKTLFSFFKEIFINKDIITAHWVGHSLLKELYYHDFFERKQMI